uniref:Uncharacterized protein n=1 Tax=uncultured bacterium Contigcl_1539 TaxID=1393650 RepID=W0FR08_9BACT|nr:hypothetical protein [uncultured bacterium Contigcl_1539]
MLTLLLINTKFESYFTMLYFFCATFIRAFFVRIRDGFCDRVAIWFLMKKELPHLVQQLRVNLSTSDGKTVI